MDYVLMSVLKEEHLNENLQSLEEGGGWEYVLYLHSYNSMQGSVKNAWETHYENESKKNKWVKPVMEGSVTGFYFTLNLP